MPTAIAILRRLRDLSHSDPQETLTLFFRLFTLPHPPSLPFPTAFSCAARTQNLPAGLLTHQLHLKHVSPILTSSSANAAADMYFKAGLISDAHKVFDEMPVRNVASWTVFLSGILRAEGLERALEIFGEMPERNVVSWTVVVSGCVEGGRTREAFKLLVEMRRAVRVEFNWVGVCSVLSACARVGDLAVVRWVHVFVVKVGMLEGGDGVLMVRSALVDAYTKCGRIDVSRRLFGSYKVRNVVTWNAMLSGLALHGLGREAVEFFNRMMVEGVRPDDISFVGVLSACARSGLVEDGLEFFHKKMPVFGVTPKMEHYACLVDVLGRAGHLEEAEAVIRQMPFRPNEVVLGSLLASCAIHGKSRIGSRIVEELVEMDPLNTEYHVLMSNLYASAGKNHEANDVREGLKKRGIRKIPGMSYITIDGCINRFTSGDKRHHLTDQLYAKLDEMTCRLRLAGYVPESASQVSRLMDSYLGDDDGQEEREQVLFSHSERLAIALGLICTKPGTPLQIFKNLRICWDCHSAAKLISRVYEREITIRDRNRFHCFKMGSCSCSDYW